MRAKKSYGQHFLNNEAIAERIADSLLLTDSYAKIVEVGPGRGMLTKYLMKKDKELVVIEADRDMVLAVQKNFPALKGQIIAADFLKVPLKEFFKDEPFALIGNYPYNISSQILFKMLEYREQIPEMVGMFQKEVADRIVAPAGSKIYGVTSVLVKAYYDGKVLFNVAKGNFNPPPKVESAVIRLVRKTAPLGCDYKLLRQVVKQSFGQRRKMLRNTMKSFSKNPEFLSLPILSERPEQLSLEDFVALTNLIEKYKGEE